MDEKIKRLRKDRIKASILIIILIGCVALLTVVLLTATNTINIDNLSARVTSLNANVADASGEVTPAASYDELTYKFNITKDASDEAIITGTLTDNESKYARFKDTSNSVVSENGKKIVLTTTSSKPKITVIVSNAPYGTVINPSFTINSENPNNKNITVDPVTITSNSIEGTIKDENNNLIGGVELSLYNAGGEAKRTYAGSDGKYVFSLPEEDEYFVKLEEEKYRVVRYEELTTNENKRILNIIVEEVTPFTLDLKKTINKLDLVIDGKKQTFNYDDESKVIRNIKKASTIEGSIYYKIYIKNVGDVKGSLTQLKDILHNGLTFDDSKNPGWELKDGNLYYTILDGKDIDVSETVEVNLVLDIEKTNEAKNYINEVIGKGETFKNVVYILDNNIYKEEYVIEGEKVDNITPTVQNFGGWYTDRKYTNKYNFDNEVTKNLILYGKIENNKYDVTFIDKNPSTEQETIIETKTINEGETVDFPTNIPEHIGYTFKCFTLNDECISELEVREDTTLYTKYTVNKYDINYDYDGGTVTEDNPDTYTVKDEITLHNPEKEGYTFLGWTGTDLSEPTVDVTIPRGSTGNRSYTANFEIKRSTLTINPRGGSYEGDYGPIIITEDYGTVLTISDSERIGYTFKRYNKVGGGTFNNNVFTFNDEDAELNAVYEIDTYTISYDNITPAERETISNPVEYNVETETFTLTNPETRTDIYGPSEDFLGWDDGSGNVSLTVTIPKGSIGNRSYTAVWRINQNEYDIFYNYNGGSLDEGVTNPSKYTRETETFTLNTPHKTGYNFIGWTNNEILVPVIVVTIPKGSAGNRSYIANYDPIPYTISYDGITEEERATLSNPTSYNIETETFQLANPEARKDEQGYPKYDFLGWDDGEGNVSINVTITKGSTGDRSYTARWKDNEDEYAITYDEAGGSYPEGVTNPNTYKRKTATFTLHNPSKEGYDFAGWSGTGIDGTSMEVTIPKGSVGDRSYVAHFTPITYSISYDGITEEEREALSNPTSYNIESGEIILHNPDRRVDAQGLNSEDFVGWDDGSGNPSMEIIIPTGSIGNKSYTATWVTNEDPYGITYELYGGEYDEGKTNPSTYTRLTPTFKLNNPHKTGYDFDGWTTDEPGSTPVLEVTIEKGSAGNRKYYANYTPITYTINYDIAGGSVSGNPGSYTIESNEITLINPTKEGYEFDGWSGTGITGTSKNVKIPTGSTGERSYVAHFTPITYDINYKLNGGSATNPGTYTIESNTITLNNPTKTGYTFTGWSGTDLVGDDNQSVSIPTGSIGDRSYEAHYSLDVYTITYDYNEGALDPGETNPGTYTYESETITFKTPKKTGYTFRNYTLDDTTTIIDEIPTHSTGNKKLVANYDIDRFNIYFYNGEELFGSELVDYNTKVTPLSMDPTKAHHIFLYWSEDGVAPYDYDTLITANKTLYAVYEEVVSPTISFNPSLDTTTNKTWTCDNSNDSDCGVTVTIAPAANDYETYYKVGDGSYVLYTEAFKVYNNETVSAFSKKSNISSVEVSETINNIDKINPTIDETSFEAKVAAFSIKLTGNIVDNESGIKYYELYILDQDRDLLPSDQPYTTSEIYPGDHEDVTVDFRFTGLQNLTEYKMFVKAYDYVGNSQLFSMKAETTDYVARIVGRGNIPYSDESQWEKFESLQDAIDSCGAIQCTIQLNPEVVNESVEINDAQDITLDIDNKLLTSGSNYTVKVNENGKFTLIDDSNEHGGKITNTFSKAIVNEGIFTLGSGSTETLISLPTEYPVIEGAVIGLDNYGTFYFFDGYVKATDGEGHSAAVDNTGAETITQYPYNIISTKDGDMLVESLKKVDDPEARIKSVYYTKLNATTGESAIPSTNNGTYENENVKLLSQIKQYGEYGFIYNPTEDSIRSANDVTYNSEAISYVKVDLRNYNETQYLLLNTSVNTLSSSDYGYIAVSETYGDLSNKILTITGLYNGTYRVIELEPNKTYYIYFGFVKATRERSNSSTYFKVNSASILNTNTAINDLELMPNTANYFFEKQADGSYINNSKTGSAAGWGTLTDSYAMFDLTNMESDLNLILDYDINTAEHPDYRGYVYLTNSSEAQSYSDTSNRVLTTNGQYKDRVTKITIPHGQVSYLHFGYYGWADGRYYDNSFKINRLVFEKVGSVEDVNKNNIHYNEDDISTPEVESTDQYHFNYIDYDPFTWRDSSGNNNDAVNRGALLSENRTYYSFANNSYMTINYANLNFTDYEESVYVEYSTTSSGNMLLYNGSDKERIAIGFHDTYIIVSQRGNAATYPKPADYNDGQKHNILVTHKSGTWYLYYDGEVQTPSTRYDAYNIRNGYIYLGTNAYGNYPYTGNIYQVRIFDQKIEPEDVHNDEHLVVYLNPTTQADRSIYMNNNVNVLSTNAHSYLVYDLTNVNTDKYLKINYSLSARYTDYAKVLVNTSPDCPVSTDTNGLYLKTNGIVSNQDVVVKLKKNQVNYVHLNFDRERWSDAGYQNYFIINSMRVYDDYTSAELDGASTINTTNKSQSIFNLPVAKLNEDPSVVVMLKDVTSTSTIEIPEEKQMVLDLNGHTLSSSVADYLINNKGNLTITDGKYSNDMIDLEERYEEQIIENQEKREQYEADLAEYEEYAGLCEDCEPSAEYILDNYVDRKFEYTGDYVEYIAPITGEYKLQVWGAQGGYRTNSEMGGKGGYSEGIITLQENEKIYVYVGGSGNTGGAAGGFNGGGSKTTYPGGGGATDIRVNGNTLYNRIIVAGGGGSDGASTFPGKAGGGLVGITATETNYCSGGEGGTQTTAGTRGDFGLGGSGGYNAAGWGGGGFGGAGGGGWYGGGGANPDRSDDDRGGGGGSGFVYDGTNTVPTGYDVGTHILTSSKTLDGTSNEIPTYDGTGTMTGNSGDGYARVTCLNEEAIAEKRSQLPKTYNVKTKPVRNYYETESGKVFIPFHEDYLKTNTTTLSSQTIEASKITLTVQENNSLSEVYHINKMGSNIISGNAKVNYLSNAYGTLYVGFASSPDLRVDDYVEYKTFDIRTYNNKNIDFTVKYTGENDVYFKIILKSTSNNNAITAEINSLYFDTYNAAANYAGLSGNVTSGSYDIFLNNTGATLNIEDAILNINKANANAIVNRGNLTFGEMSTINVNAGSAIGIYNETTGTMEPSPGKINVIGDNAYGIKNTSHDNSIDNLNIETTKSNQYAVVNFSDGTDVVFNNLNIYGAGTGFYNLNNGDVTINNSSISSTNNDAILLVREPSNYKFIINSSNIYGLISAHYDANARELRINNSNLYGTNGNIHYGLGTVTIRDSYLENLYSSYNIYNSGRLYIYDSNVVGVNTILYNYGDTQKSSYAYLKDTNFKLLYNNEINCIDNYGTLEIEGGLEGTNIDTDYGTNQTGIANRSGAYLNINGNSTISSKYKTAINNEGYLKIGTSYNNYKNVYNYDYTGGIQEFTAPQTGNYKIEAWGAQGGYARWGDGSQFLGGNGAYTSGDIILTEGETLYINVGSEGSNRYTYDFWGMPYSTYLLASVYNTGGIVSGGATDISLSSEENKEIFTQGYSNFGSLKSIRSEESYLQRIMVAGGGGQKYDYPDANSVGLALSDSTGTVSQTTGYAFGYGSDYFSDGNLSGGSGYFGGSANQGGTSYISGYLGAVAMDGSASNPKCTMAEAASDITCSYHTSGKIFTNTVMKAGNEEMPTHDGKGTMRGNFGHGFVKITYLDGEVTPDTITDNPKIGASTTAITGKGVVEFLDGEITSQGTILNTAIDEIPDGYDLYLTNDGKTVKLKLKDSEPYVAQIGNVKYTSLDYAIDAAEAGDEIVILEDLIEADSFDIDKNLTIDYNGHVIHAFNSEYLFKNNAKLKLYDSTNSPKTNGVYSDNLVYNNGELIIDNLQYSDQVSSATLIYNNSKVDIDNSVFAINAYDYKANSQFLYNTENSEAKINNSTLKSLQSGYQSGGTFIDNYGSLEIKNTNYTHSSRGEGIVNRSTGDLILDNYKMTYSWGTTSLVQNYNKLTFKNSNTIAYVYTNTGYITLENNTITSGEINIVSDSLMTIKSGTYSNTFSINGTGKSVDQNGTPIDQDDNPYSFIMEDGTINKTLNLNATGFKWIKGGSIIPNADNAINNTTSSKMILGINDGNVDPKSTTKPIITGNKYAIYTTNYDFVIDFYDGILTGEHSTDAIFETTENGYQIHRDYENNKEIEYLKQEVVFKDVETNTNYYSTNEVNTAISNGTINSGDTLQVVNDFVILELHDPIEIPTGFTLNFDLNNHVVEQDDEELFINNGTLIIDDSAYQSDPNNDSGVIKSKLGEIIINNGTLTINGGGFEGERHSVISTVIENNGTLTINDGTFTKYYDEAGYYKVAMGSIIENNGTASILGGTYKVPSSYIEAYNRRIDNNSCDYLRLASVFKNNSNGVLNVTGGTYPVTTDKTWYDRDSYYRTDYYYTNSGELIENYGTATISDITSSNTHIGLNAGTLTLDNITMDNIGYVNSTNHPNLINTGDLVITDSSFETHSSFVNNTGNLDITNTTIDKKNDLVHYYYYNGTREGDTNLYRNDEDNSGYHKNSFVIRNNYNSAQDNVTNITGSTIYNRGSGEVIDNNAIMNINNSTIESTTANNAINNKKILTIYGNSEITSTAAIGINNTNTATLNLGKPAIEDGEVSQSYPLITGETYGISNAGTFNFYDGYIRGKTHATSGNVTTTEAGYSFSNPTAAVDGYNVAYLDQIKVIRNVQIGEEYFTIAEAVAEASSGDTLQMISNDNVLNTAATIIIDKQLTLDLNGYTINQGNNILFRNESTFTINDSNTSGNNKGGIEVASGTVMLDNFGDLVINGGTYNTSSERLIIKNEALTSEEINNSVPEHTVTLQNNANLNASDNTVLVENNGKMDVYNGAFLKNVYVYPARNVIVNNKELNVVDLNKDDDPNTSSNLTAPWIYSQGNTSADSGDIYNTSGATLNIYGGIFNNGGTYDQGSTQPDQVYIVYNAGTANIKNLDNYSFGIIRNQGGTASIENSHFYNTVEFGIHCNGGTISMKDTIIENSGTRYDLWGTDYEYNLTNATLDNVTVINKSGGTIGKGAIGFSGTSIVRNSNITVNSTNTRSLGNFGTLTIENSTITMNNSFYNNGTLNFVNSTLTSSSNGFINDRILNISGSSSIESTNGLGINNTSSNSVINLGTQDGVVDVTQPLIVGTTYGIDNSYTGAKINFYDGLVEGEGGPTAINGVITTAEGGYIPDYINNESSSDGKYQVKLKDGSASVVIIAKVGNISFSSQDDPYVTATEALQLAINTAANSGRGVDLLQDITIDQNLTATTPVTVYRNGHTETFEPGITATNVTFINGQAPLASLARLLGNVAGSGDDGNNIVIYEMNDGSELTTTKTYELYLDGNLIGLNEEEAGIYSYRGNTNELRPIKGKIYINELTSGNYKLKSSDNKVLDFSIDSDGNITGNVKKYNKPDSGSSIYATSIAELIIAIQTGMIRFNYLLLIIPIIIIILLLLFLIRKNNKKVSQ